MLTDPQNDVPCTSCETEGSRSRLNEDGLCPDCRTPAGRLVTALAARGVKATIDGDHALIDGEIRGYVAPGGWEIACDDVGDEDDAIEAAADAIAAIVQAPGLRAERDTLAARVKELEAENARLTSRVETFAGALLALGAS